jgi:hypothetical protein
MLTVAIRGPLAGRMREMAERYRMSLAKLLQDAVLVYEARGAEGCKPGASLAHSVAQ